MSRRLEIRLTVKHNARQRSCPGGGTYFVIAPVLRPYPDRPVSDPRTGNGCNRPTGRSRRRASTIRRFSKRGSLRPPCRAICPPSRRRSRRSPARLSASPAARGICHPVAPRRYTPVARADETAAPLVESKTIFVRRRVGARPGRGVAHETYRGIQLAERIDRPRRIGGTVLAARELHPRPDSLDPMRDLPRPRHDPRVPGRIEGEILDGARGQIALPSPRTLHLPAA